MESYLSERERERYARQIILPEVGEEGVIKLKESSVLIVGAGGLGSPVASYLTAAGIGRIGIVEFDSLSESNLQRQILYSTPQIGKKKVECAKERLSLLNPYTKVEIYDYRLRRENVEQLFAEYDIIVDATDNAESRYVINDGALATGKPFIYGSVAGFMGQVALFNYKGGKSYRDLYPENESEIKGENVKNSDNEGAGKSEEESGSDGAIKGKSESKNESKSESKSENKNKSESDSPEKPNGIIGAHAGIIGSIEAMECIKTLLGRPSLKDILLVVNTLTMEFTLFEI